MLSPPQTPCSQILSESNNILNINPKAFFTTDTLSFNRLIVRKRYNIKRRPFKLNIKSNEDLLAEKYKYIRYLRSTEMCIVNELFSHEQNGKMKIGTQYITNTNDRWYADVLSKSIVKTFFDSTSKHHAVCVTKGEILGSAVLPNVSQRLKTNQKIKQVR